MSLLSAFWIVPFVLNHKYMTDMKYHGEPGSGSFTSYWDMFFHLPPFWTSSSRRSPSWGWPLRCCAAT
jgi:hypothetical protein